MKLKYANQLTEYELGELCSAFIETYGGFKIEPIEAYVGAFTIDLSGCYYDLDDDKAETLLYDSFEINDYGVLDNTFGFGYNIELTKILRKFMLNKFGKPYMKDCFWYDFGGNLND